MVKRWKQIWYTSFVDWHHLFIPHKKTHQKAHLISWHGLVIYVLLFILLQVSFSIVSYLKPGVLGISTRLDYKKVIELTNKEREKAGLSPVAENLALDQAAEAKGEHMFTENYWAHFAPSGKTPWDFILSSGYKFTFAGENLAKNFYTEEDIVTAWMASPSHRENVLSSRYKDIGLAVVEGVLNGQKTILVVQMFGSTDALAAFPNVNVGGEKISLSRDEYNKPIKSIVLQIPQTASIKPLLDPYQVYKYAGIFVISLISTLLLVDFIVLRKRGIFRITSHHFSNMIFLAVAVSSVISHNPGVIL